MSLSWRAARLSEELDLEGRDVRDSPEYARVHLQVYGIEIGPCCACGHCMSIFWERGWDGIYRVRREYVKRVALEIAPRKE